MQAGQVPPEFVVPPAEPHDSRSAYSIVAGHRHSSQPACLMTWRFLEMEMAKALRTPKLGDDKKRVDGRKKRLSTCNPGRTPSVPDLFPSSWLWCGAVVEHGWSPAVHSSTSKVACGLLKTHRFGRMGTCVDVVLLNHVGGLTTRLPEMLVESL